MEEYNGAYPQYGIRANAFASVYAKIAIDHFVKAQKEFEEHCKDEFSFIHRAYDIREDIIVCQTFSAFAVEAYLNDYISATLLDEDYTIFDRLSCLSKLELISICLFQKRVSKSSEIYCKIKELFHDRDSIAHNKSKDFTKMFSGMTEEECEAYEKWRKENPEEEEKELERTIANARESAIELLAEGYDALRTMFLLVDYFLENGEAPVAELRLFAWIYGKVCIFNSKQPEIDKNSPYYELIVKLKEPAPNSYRRQFINKQKRS